MSLVCSEWGYLISIAYYLFSFDLMGHGVLLFLRGAKVLLHSESDVSFEQSMFFLQFNFLRRSIVY